MTSIEQLIGDLLLQNNCVIVPSFGGFVAQQVAAKIDFESGKMFPPSKSLLFNKQLVNNDGLLINEFANRAKINFDQASFQVNEKVQEWNNILSSGGRIELDRIGFLYNDAENNLCFEQDRFFNLLLESFGLGQVHFLTEEDVQLNEQRIIKEETAPVIVPITTEKIEIAEEANVEKTIVVEHPEVQKKKTKIWKYVAAACILPIAFYSFWIPMKTNVLESGIVSFQDFNPFHNVKEASYNPEFEQANFDTPKESKQTFDEVVEELPSDVSVYSYKYDDAFFIPVKVKNTESSVATETIESENSFDANAMHYIVGCFGQETNAKNLVAKLKDAGLDAKIIDVKNGLHRVSAGSAISMEALSEIKSTSSSLGLKGWTLK